MNAAPAKNSKLILAAMIFAVSMTFIDQTIVAISLPTIQGDVHLSTTGSQWIINGYLLSLSALFAFGGRLADIAGHRRMVVLGIVIFAVCSALCGATPTGSLAETWLIVFRILQGAGAAIMFPAALAIVLESFPVAERGRAMAIFFGIAGGLTSIGPIAGGYLTEWTWRSIFWINVPVAIIALFLTWKAKPGDERHPGKLDYKGTVLVCGGMGLVVLGLQQSAIWGWDDAKTWVSIVLGLGILGWFVKDQLGSQNPLLRLRIFENRAFAVDNAVLFFLMIAFVPLFFFASEYAQISLGESASETGLYFLIFFAGFATATQWGGKMLDRIGARRPVVLGCAIGAVGFYLWGKSMTHLSVSEQWYYIVLAGLGVGLVLSPANTDALNRVPRSRLRRGDRDHPDGPQLRLQRRPRDPRLAADHLEQVEPGERRDRQGHLQGQGRCGRRMRGPRRSRLQGRRPGARSEGGRGSSTPCRWRSPKRPGTSSTGWPSRSRSRS